MNRIELKINDDKSMEVVTPQPLVEGENLTTEISVEIPASWAGSAIRALITTPLGKLVDAVDASVPVGLTNTMLDGKGALYVEYVAMKDGAEIARTKSPALLPVSAARSLIGEIDPAPLPDLVAEMVAAKGGCDGAAAAAVLATERIETTDADIQAAEAIREAERLKWTNATAQATTLEPDAQATASVTDGETGKVFSIGVPRGEAGTAGYTPQKGIDYFDGTNGEDTVARAMLGDVFNNSFTSENYLDNMQDILPVTSPAWSYMTSTFSAWGSAIGNPQNFDHLVFTVRNRSANANPITSIRAVVKIFNKSGAVLADRTISDYNILPGESLEVWFDLDTIVVNSGAVQLWAMFWCNQTIDVWGGSAGVYLVAPTYGNTCYTNSGNMSAISTLYDPDLVNTGKPVMYATTVSKYYKPTPQFVGSLDSLDVVFTTKWSKDIALPPKIYAVVGREINVYFDNLISDNARKYWFDCVCPVGTQQSERWTFVPTAVGSWVLQIDVYDDMDNLIHSALTTVIAVSASAQTGTTKTCLFMGDSTTEPGVYTGELITLMSVDPMDVTLIGSVGTAPNLNEGHSGWKVSDFYSKVESPFVVSGAFNFANYMAVRGFTGVDWVFILLGINDVFGCVTDVKVDAVSAENVIRLESMISGIKAFNANAKIGICTTTPPSAFQDAFGKNYTSGQTQRRCKHNIHRYVMSLISAFSGQEASGIYVIPTNVNLDTVNNMVTETVAVNSRNSTTMTRQSNGVHPAVSGQYQIADTMYCALKCIV